MSSLLLWFYMINIDLISHLFPNFQSCTTDNSPIVRSNFQLLQSKGNVKIAQFVKTSDLYIIHLNFNLSFDFFVESLKLFLYSSKY